MSTKEYVVFFKFFIGARPYTGTVGTRAGSAYSDSIRPLFRQESGHCSGRKAAGIPF